MLKFLFYYHFIVSTCLCSKNGQRNGSNCDEVGGDLILPDPIPASDCQIGCYTRAHLHVF